MQSGIMDPGCQLYKGPSLIAQRTCHRPGVGQCTFLVITIISWVVAGVGYAAVTVVKTNAKYDEIYTR